MSNRILAGVAPTEQGKFMLCIVYYRHVAPNGARTCSWKGMIGHIFQRHFKKRKQVLLLRAGARQIEQYNFILRDHKNA